MVTDHYLINFNKRTITNLFITIVKCQVLAYQNFTVQQTHVVRPSYIKQSKNCNELSITYFYNELSHRTFTHRSSTTAQYFNLKKKKDFERLNSKYSSIILYRQ